MFTLSGFLWKREERAHNRVYHVLFDVFHRNRQTWRMIVRCKCIVQLLCVTYYVYCTSHVTHYVYCTLVHILCIVWIVLDDETHYAKPMVRLKRTLLLSGEIICFACSGMIMANHFSAITDCVVHCTCMLELCPQWGGSSANIICCGWVASLRGRVRAAYMYPSLGTCMWIHVECTLCTCTLYMKGAWWGVRVVLRPNPPFIYDLLVHWV